MRISRLFATVSSAALAATLLSSTAGLAAPAPALAAASAAPSRADHHAPIHARGPMHGGGGAAFGRTDHVEGRIAFLRAELKITDDQTPQWDAVAQAMRDQSAKMTALREELRSTRGEGGRDRAEQRRTLTAPEILDRREKAMATRAKALTLSAEGQRQFAAAFGSLYERLNDDQKKMADRLLAARHRRI